MAEMISRVKVVVITFKIQANNDYSYNSKITSLKNMEEVQNIDRKWMYIVKTWDHIQQSITNGNSSLKT